MRHRSAMLWIGAALALLLLPSLAVAADAPNHSGRLATTTLVDLGGRTSALYAFASDGTSFAKQLFWQSAPGAFDASKAKLACGDLNNDGNPDALVLYDLGRGRCALYAFLSSGTSYEKTTAWQGALTWAKAKLCVGDINGDGAADAYVLSAKNAKTCVLYSFTSASTPSDTAAPAPVNSRLGASTVK